MNAILFSYPASEAEFPFTFPTFGTLPFTAEQLAGLDDLTMRVDESPEVILAVAVSACLTAMASEPSKPYPDEDNPF
jgi:hypothetical protein